MQNSQKYNMEQLFQDMRPLPAYKEREDATCKEIFDKNVIEGWYRARDSVIHLLKHDENMGASGIKPSSSDHIHVIIHYKGNPLALYIARQVALVAHFPNFKENSVGNKNRTIITLLYNRNRQTDILQELKKQENLCNLPDVCKYVIKDGNTGKIVREDHTSSYIDVELELVAFDNDDMFLVYFADGFRNPYLEIPERCIRFFVTAVIGMFAFERFADNVFILQGISSVIGAVGIIKITVLVSFIHRHCQRAVISDIENVHRFCNRFDGFIELFHSFCELADVPQR